MNFDPATASGALFWGVAAGVLISGLLFTIGVIFAKVVVPWYQALVYQGVDLSGHWVQHQDHGGIAYDYSMVLKQAAHDLKGTMTLTKSGAPPGPRGDYVQGFDVSGSTWEGFVTLNMRSSDRRGLAFATSLLEIQDRGKSLSGVLAFRSTGGEASAEPLTWTRP